ncbi:MAG: 50S ribosomal protein L3 [Puniceicoccales bacterium]|jgi:large subunit ribosomal protein L3|nr:50S ribosomal protein L3 [Puniceicoccales bacterium]
MQNDFCRLAMENKREIFLMGRKLGMTQVYDGAGACVAVTAIEVCPCPVVAVRTLDHDEYVAVQIAAEKLGNARRCTNSMRGFYAKANLPTHKQLREFRVPDSSEYAPGEFLDLSLLHAGDMVDIRGVTKGRGFQGVVKRYGFDGGPGAHGSMFHRRGGSYGQREEPGKIYKGRKMPGHMGAVARTVQNLQVIRVCADEKVCLVKGSVMGANGNLIIIRTAKKDKR